ncbi:MAG: ABC transporter substrate-binding protein, partial [Candidatus Thorarchaeota archaeon]|nr:ABC transporter substrate-binding protein [Candidatus Thorarchaeota archaeon]
MVLGSIETKRRLRKILIVVFFASFLIFGTCGTVLYISPPAPTGQTMTWEVSGFPMSLDPHDASSEQEKWIISNVYESLVSPPVVGDETHEFTGQLAKSWSISEGIEYIFSLEENVLFHDGTPFNASCVKYNFERMLAFLQPYGPALGIAEHILRGQAIVDAV